MLLPGPKSAYVAYSEGTSQVKNTAGKSEAAQDSSKWRKVVLSRYLLENGRISFALGTRFGGTITRDPGEVALENIYDYVSPSELERFENEEYEKEDEREEELDRIAATRRQRGRPRKIVTSFGALALSARKSSEDPFAAPIKRLRGRPRKYPIPSFNGPAPIHDTSASEGTQTMTRAQSDIPTSVSDSRQPQGRRRIYSLVAAAGLGSPMGSADEDTSRDVTPLPEAQSHEDEPYPKRSRLESYDSGHARSLSPILELGTGLEARAIGSQFRDREALIRQFHISKTRQRKSSISSSDSLMSRIEVLRPPIPASQSDYSKKELTTPVKDNQRKTSLTPHFPSTRPAIVSTTNHQILPAPEVRLVTSPSLKRKRSLEPSPIQRLNPKTTTGFRLNRLQASNNIKSFFSKSKSPASPPPPPLSSSRKPTSTSGFLSKPSVRIVPKQTPINKNPPSSSHRAPGSKCKEPITATSPPHRVSSAMPVATRNPAPIPSRPQGNGSGPIDPAHDADDDELEHEEKPGEYVDPRRLPVQMSAIDPALEMIGSCRTDADELREGERWEDSDSSDSRSSEVIIVASR